MDKGLCLEQGCRAKTGLCREKGIQKRNQMNFYTKGPIYRKLSYCQVRGVRSIVAIALECSHVCDRSQMERSIAHNYLRNSTAQGWK